MNGYPALRDEELDRQQMELLPARETLWSINVANVVGVNISLAINAASYGAPASSVAAQQLSLALHH